jgi:fumarate hydratase class I
MGKRGQGVLTAGGDERAIARGIFDAYQELNLRYSQLAPIDMCKEENTCSNLPAQIELYATDGDEYHFLFMTKGGGSANKSLLFQETKALLNPASLAKFFDAKLRSLGTSACPPYHLAVVIGGTSAEYALKTAKLASARYLDDLPQQGSLAGHAIRDVEWEQKILATACSSSSSRPTRPSTCPRPRPRTWAARWCASISPGRWRRSAPSSRAIRSRRA